MNRIKYLEEILKLNLNTISALVLEVVAREELTTLTAISIRIGRSSAAMTQIKDSLERKHLITCVRSFSDRRSWHIDLTQEGWDAINLLERISQ